MRLISLTSIAFVSVFVCSSAIAQTKSQRCEVYARDAMRQTPTTTGAARGAARGAVVGAIAGDPGRGAAIGAAVGGARRIAQKSRSYSYYYDSCMRG
jgi:uncharacterized membrane protein